tara:strand:- start:356 stop:646 length:291 start_codon:yes stop_codon:yes gene_type:complete
MKTTNAIEKALQTRISNEVSAIVDDFISDLEKLSNKYGGSSFYDFTESNASDARTFMVSGISRVKGVLHRMVLDNHGDSMLRYKSKELINKLDLYE